MEGKSHVSGSIAPGETVWVFQGKKSATQSGLGKKKFWIVEFTSPKSLFKDPITGWTGTKDTRNRMQLVFESKAEALDFAKNQNLKYFLVPPPVSEIVAKSYSDNFQGNRAHL